MSQKRIGVIISYLNLIMSMIVNIFLIPLMIKSFGDIDYSIYKVMQSFAGPLAMFHLGISTVVTRSIVKYHSEDNYTETEKQNTMAMALLVSGLMSLLVAVAGVVMYVAIPSMYGDSYTAESLALGCEIFSVFVISSIFHMMTDAFSGCVVGREKFVVSAAVPLMKTVLKVLLMGIFLMCGMNVFYIALADLLISVFTFAVLFFYAVFGLHEIPRLYYLDKRQLIEIFSFGTAILLQAIVNQVNNNMDTMILGAFVEEKAIITMYSSALTVYAIYNSLVSVITTFFLPKATRLISRNASGKELTDFVIFPGRFQAMIAVACVFGFLLFGQNFISVWIGAQYMDAYWVTLLLMIPVTIPLVENAAISILDASLKRMYRSVVLVVMAVINVIVSIILVRLIGFWGAAIGTFASLIIGHGILMNIYYAKTFKMEIGRMFRSIFKGVLPAGMVASIVCIPLAVFVENTVIFFLIKCVSFLVVYALLLWLFGMNSYEKGMVKEAFAKFNAKIRG